MKVYFRLVSFICVVTFTVMATRLWPDLSCHPGYSSIFLKHAFNWCSANLHNGIVQNQNHCVTKECCMLHMMGILYIYGHREGQAFDTVYMNHKGRRFVKQVLMGEFDSTVSSSDEIETLVNKMVSGIENCNYQFEQLYVKQNYTDLFWAPLYNCIENATSCYGLTEKKVNLIS